MLLPSVQIRLNQFQQARFPSLEFGHHRRLQTHSQAGHTDHPQSYEIHRSALTTQGKTLPCNLRSTGVQSHTLSPNELDSKAVEFS